MNDRFKIINYLNKLKSKPKKNDIDFLIKKFKISIPKNKNKKTEKYDFIKKKYKIKKVELFNEITISMLRKKLQKYNINNIGNKKKMWLLYRKQLDKLPQSDITSAYYSNIGRRDYQEDRISIYNNSFYYISGVFDGHAGNKCSTYLKKNFYKIFMKNLRLKKNPMGALYLTFFELDENFLNNVNSNDGSTANILFCNKSTKMCYLANTGDSRAILCRNNGVVKQISKDHKPDDVKERRKIEGKGGFVRDGRTNGNLAMSRAFGDKYLKKVITVEPEISYFPMRNIKYVLQASDGLFDVMTNTEICNFINTRLNKNIRLEQICKQLVLYAIQIKGSYDNTSVVLTLIS